MEDKIQIELLQLLRDLNCIVINNDDIPLVAVMITLMDDKGTVVGTTTTSATGEYAFRDALPGDFT